MSHSFLQLKVKSILVLLIAANLFACSSGGEVSQTSSPSYNQYSPPRQNYNYNSPPSYYGSPYQYQYPSSRQYNNPYALPPQSQYPYYDGDQYYVPPTYYGRSINDNSAINQKF